MERQRIDETGIGRRLLAVARDLRRGDATAGTLLDRLGADGLGLVLLLLTLPTIAPVPGPFGMAFGSLIAIVAVQVLLGAETFWLPAWLRRRPVPTRGLRLVLVGFRPWLRRADRVLSGPRLVGLVDAGARRWLGIAILAMAAIIALPIPFGNVVPALALLTLALGLLVRDGAAVLAAVLLSAVAVAWTGALILGGAAVLEAVVAAFER